MHKQCEICEVKVSFLAALFWGAVFVLFAFKSRARSRFYVLGSKLVDRLGGRFLGRILNLDGSVWSGVLDLSERLSTVVGV